MRGAGMSSAVFSRPSIQAGAKQAGVKQAGVKQAAQAWSYICLHSLLRPEALPAGRWPETLQGDQLALLQVRAQASPLQPPVAVGAWRERAVLRVQLLLQVWQWVQLLWAQGRAPPGLPPWLASASQHPAGGHLRLTLRVRGHCLLQVALHVGLLAQVQQKQAQALPQQVLLQQALR